jgi:membrane-bound transcription factor site-1 protease
MHVNKLPVLFSIHSSGSFKLDALVTLLTIPHTKNFIFVCISIVGLFVSPLQLSSILGMMEAGEGRIAVYGDSNCLDSSHMVTNCYWLLRKIVDFTGNRVKDPILFSEAARLNFPVFKNIHQPSRRPDVNFSIYSRVIGKELFCHHDSRFEVWGTRGYGVQPSGTARKLPEYQSNEGSTIHNLTEASDSRQDVISFQRKFSTPNDVKLDEKRDYFGFIGHEEVSHLAFPLPMKYVF